MPWEYCMDNMKVWLLLTGLVLQLQLLQAGVTAEDPGYDLLVLLPLTGDRADQGRALLAGLRAALPPAVNLSGPDLPSPSPGHILTPPHGNPFTLPDGPRVRLTYVDTQCDRTSEDAAILHLLAASTRPLVVLGGLCPQTLQDPDTGSAQSSLYVRLNTPQVTFDDSFLPAEPQAVSPVSLRPSVRSAYRPLVGWLRTTDCRHVILLTSSFTLHEKTKALKTELLDSKITISLELDTSNANVGYLLKESLARVVLVQADSSSGRRQICRLVNVTRTMPGRYVWVLLTTDAVTSLRPCPGQTEYNVMVFSVQTRPLHTEQYESFARRLHETTPSLSAPLLEAAVTSYDTLTLTLETLTTLYRAVPRMSRQQFTDRFVRHLTRGARAPVTGDVWFDYRGIRDVKVEIHVLNEYGLVPSNRSSVMSVDGSVTYPEVSRQVTLQGIPLAAFVVMSSLALLGVIYALLILIFNLLKRNDKMIKMTSPNINLVIVFGAIMGYVAMVTLGLDSSKVTLKTMAKLVQASTFLLSLGYSLVFGSLFAKAWRVFFIFKNLNANGKHTRDEHLLFGVFLLVLADLIVLVPWAAVDPIVCSRVYGSAAYQPSPPTDVIYQRDVCASGLTAVWVLVLFALKGGVLVAGVYFTFQARHVTLPTLRDAREVYEAVCTVCMVGALTLPALLTPMVGVHLQYVIGATAIFIVVTATLTLIFVPKMYFMWRQADRNSPDSIRFLFSESLRRTQRHLASCSLCFCLGEESEDKYAQEVLGSEIDTLKRTIKEKDATIRELTDRLYFGTEKKLHEYISSPRRFQSPAPESVAAYQQRIHSPSQQTLPAAHTPRSALPSPPTEGAHDSSQESADAMYRNYCRRSRRSERQRRRSPHPAQTATPPVGLSVHHLKEGGFHTTTAGGVAVNGGVFLQSPHGVPQTSPLYHQTHTDVSSYQTPQHYSQGRREGTEPAGVNKYSTPSPNHDSAIDNNSPSSAGSDQDMLQAPPGGAPWPHQKPPGGEPWQHQAPPGSDPWPHPGGLDLEAIEQEAVRIDRYHYPDTHCSDINSYYENGVAVSQI